MIVTLYPEQIGIFPIERHQRIMGSFFGDPPVGQKHNSVAEAGRSQAVRDIDRGVACGHLIIFLVNFIFGNGVQSGSGFIQYQDGTICLLFQFRRNP